VACFGLDHWLWTIARCDTVATDRAHVMIAAALLGKNVEYHGTNYHKVNAIAEYSLSDFPVVLTGIL
jgi:exopolysaccharide biosynthesis predicted pyruvyltransferase EpsI